MVKAKGSLAKSCKRYKKIKIIGAYTKQCTEKCKNSLKTVSASTQETKTHPQTGDGFREVIIKRDRMKGCLMSTGRSVHILELQQMSPPLTARSS